ncbi:response regulator transcription factor [Cohnella cellulosilytica]|uniref:Response regulator transcription factor n=1 Tax=Cohnella cellulosilytica TaxID=986710 RepID=A0ABW2F3K3_9BACL
MSATILIIDDDADFQEMIRLFLVNEGFRVAEALNGKQGLSMLQRQIPDLILLDLQMPDVDGATLCKRIRQTFNRPILFLSGNKQQEHILNSLASGGDDYITKPFDPLELVARIKSNLRWSAQIAATKISGQRLSYPGLEIDLERMTVAVNQRPVTLLAKELHLLITFAQNPHKVFHPKQLYERVWNDPASYSIDTVKVHISQLRRKIESNPAHPSYIRTVIGFGYKFDPNPDAVHSRAT